MKMTFTNKEMGDYVDLMCRLSETGKLGYAIARNQRKMADAAKEYIDLRNQLFQDLGQVHPNGQTSIDGKENVDKYKEAMGDIPEIEHEVEVFQVDEDLFIGGGLTSSQMAVLMWMVKGEEEKPAAEQKEEAIPTPTEEETAEEAKQEPGEEAS